jgi:hypothetical protein
MGSLAFVAAARAVWAVAMDEDDDERTRRFFVPLKTNLSINPTSLAFMIDNNKVIFEENPVEVDVEEALTREGSNKSALGHATTWLREALVDGPVASTDIYKMAEENRISEATLRRAKEKLGVDSCKTGAANKGKWLWFLPNHQSNDKDAHQKT